MIRIYLIEVTQMVNVYGKNVLVTGASSGIGRACALAFAKNGCVVTGVARHCEEGSREELEGGGSLAMRRMDVTDQSSVAAVVRDMPRVDIAILCAGMGIAGTAEEVPADLAMQQMDVNYFGVIRVCHEVLPRMREQGKGLLLVVSSIAGKVPIPMQSHYSSSKYAIEAYVEAVRMEMRKYGVRASLLEPGDTRTGFTAARNAFIPEDSPYKTVCEKSIARMAHDEQHGKPPESVAEVALKLAGKENPPVRVAIGLVYKLLMLILRFLPDRTAEWILSLMYLPRG